MRLTAKKPTGNTAAKARGASKAAPKGRKARSSQAPSSGLVRRLLLPGTVITLILMGGSYALVSGWAERAKEQLHQGTLDASMRHGLALNDVLVEGRERTQGQDVLAALEVQRGSPMLNFDPAAARSRLEELPWVAKAEVERRLPDTIYVNLTEREPLAVWQLRKVFQVIDQHGVVIPGVEAKNYAHLPLVVDEGAPQATRKLLDFLAEEPDLADQVVAASRIRDRRWDLLLKSGVKIRLPEEEADAAWRQLARIEKEQGLLERDVVVIDLRLPDRLVVRTSKGETPERQPIVKVKGKDT
ncbi:cell division protein FtsQ/DivIB [Rhodovibrionaceae bacterium A322]